MKRALITGITGQDGSYLTEFLLEKGYEVHGLVRRSSSFNTARINHLREQDRGVFLHYADLADSGAIIHLLKLIKPEEVYHLGAQSHVRVSFDLPEYTADITGLGTLRMLDAIRDVGLDAKFYQASSSEMFGKVTEVPQRESTPFHPRSPYACAKVFAYWTTVNYREAYHLHASNGIMFNHESPRRGENFVTRKITRGLARILAGRQSEISLGNLESRRDWGYAKDYVEAMWKMLQMPKGDDYVIATGESHSVRELLDMAFGLIDRDWNEYVRTDSQHCRPAEVDCLIGDYSKARQTLGWSPQCSFRELVTLMVHEDLQLEGLDPEKWMRP